MMFRASICLDACYRMNEKVNEIYQTGFRAYRVLALLLLLVALVLSGCVNGSSVAPSSTIALPPAPIATGTEVSSLDAYPPAAAAYPEPSVDSGGDSAAYPAPTAPEAAGLPPTAAMTAPALPDPVATEVAYFPIVGQGQIAAPVTVAPPAPTATAPFTATPAPSPTQAAAIAAQPTPIHVVDFAAAREELAAQGQQLAYNKIGFHVTFLEDGEELDPYMQRLDAEGVPFFLKSVDNAEPLYKAQELMKVSGVDHILVYRSTKYDVPNYDMDPVLAAETYWELEKAIWPPELDPDLVWLETMNELDKNRSEWLAQFSLRTAELALRDGYKWAAFGWASGEPEPEQWESPAMLELLRLIGENPDQLAIALHEYSYVAEDIGHEYPHKIGRFLDLFAVADRHGIPRPTVLITEWGWTYDAIPAEPNAMEDVTWAARLYGAYPQVLGAAIWNLGQLDGQLTPLNEQVQGLIDNMLALSLDSYFSAPALPRQAPPDAGQFPPP